MNWLEGIELEEIEVITATEETTEERNERFKITDLSSMNWALRKLKALEKAHNDDVTVYTDEVARLDALLKRQSVKCQHSQEFLTGLIEQYARGQNKLDPKWKGENSLHGKVTFNTPKDKINYGDEDKLVEYLSENGFSLLIKTVKTPIKDELKKVFPLKGDRLVNLTTGECVPEISFIKQEPVLKIVLEG